MKREYAITTTLLQNAIFDTIRLVDEYYLDDNIYANHTYKIKVQRKKYYYTFQIFKTDSGSNLFLRVQNSKWTITKLEAIHLENIFIEKLDQVVNKEVLITPEISKKDVYRRGILVMSVFKFFKSVVNR